MAYMRGNPYVYSTGIGLVITVDGHTVELPLELANDLACMIWHRLSAEEQQETIRRVAENYVGNFGADGVMAAVGKPTTMDIVREQLGD